MSTQEEYDASVAKVLAEMETQKFFVIDKSEVREEIARRRPGSEYWSIPGVGMCTEASLYTDKPTALLEAIRQEEVKVSRAQANLAILRTKLLLEIKT